MATYAQQMQRIADRYMKSGEAWPATARQIAAWAIRKKLWLPHPEKILSQCADDLARALREEYILDAQGRSVRAKHAARVKKDGSQLVLWADIRTASHEHMEIAFKQRRHQIVGDCRQLKQDVDSYNENRRPQRPIQISFNFTRDLQEIIASDAA